MTDAAAVRRFYDDLADDYERIFADWRASSRRQASALEPLLGRGAFVLDCAAGIGTQLLGLAELGHRVVGTDLSAVALHRAVERDAGVGVAAADMRALPFPDATFDAVICCDNALPHLVTPRDVVAALTEMRRVAVPGGSVLVSTRDYDELRRTRPATTPVALHRSADAVTASFQLWTWDDDGERYDFEHVLLTRRPEGWHVRSRSARYWAMSRAELSALATSAGLVDVRWQLPPESAFVQPLLVATTPVG